MDYISNRAALMPPILWKSMDRGYPRERLCRGNHLFVLRTARDEFRCAILILNVRNANKGCATINSRATSRVNHY